MKRLLSVLLISVMMFMFFSVAFADTGDMARASHVISETNVGIRFANGKIYAMGQILTVNTADKLGLSSITIYEKISGSWSAIATATAKYGYNRSDYSYTISTTGDSSKEYKVTVHFYGKIGDLTDTHTHTTYS